MRGLIGRKIGMTRIFDQGRQVPVTVLECGPCIVVQRKRQAREGYDAIQIGFEDRPEQRVSKPALGRFKKIKALPKHYLAEFDLETDKAYQEGDVVTVDLFKDVPYVDVAGITKGRGFQGVVRRHKMAGGVMSHGGQSKRRAGSVGCCELPGRIQKGKAMPGHMGRVRITQQNLRVVQVMGADNMLLVCGAVPGHPGAIVFINKALKKGKPKE